MKLKEWIVALADIGNGPPLPLDIMEARWGGPCATIGEALREWAPTFGPGVMLALENMYLHGIPDDLDAKMDGEGY